MSSRLHTVSLLAGILATSLASTARAQQPQDPYAPQPQPQPQQPAPQPYPPQPYPPQPYPPQPYPPQPYYYPPPAAPPGPETSPSDRSGDLEMMMIGGTLGIVGGLVVVDLRDIDDAGIGTISVLGTAAAGAGLGYLVSSKLEVDQGQADFCLLGTLVGVTNGALLAKPLELSGDTEDWGPFLLGTSTLGAGAGLAVAMKADFTRGQSMFASTLAISGIASTALGVAVVQGGDLEDDDSALVSLALGMDAGLVVGLAVSPMVNWSQRRASFVTVATLVGTGVGLGGGAIITGDSKDPRTVGTAGLVGLWGGMFAGIAMTSGYDPDPRFQPKGPAPAGAAPTPPAVTVVPAVTGDQVGFMVAGTM
ncbi:MAG TPA: hypothetical protein VIG06_17160 [Kofleriaceae bacterium]